MNPIHDHVCPPIAKGALKFEALQAAKSGSVDKVKSFLEDGGDINGGDCNGVPLLFAACEQGRLEVVKELLKYPDLHLNTRHMGITALAVASVNGHDDCVKILVESKLKCHLNLRVKCGFKNKNPLTAFCAAASAKQWKTFKILLEVINVINPEEVNEIIGSALDDDQWDIIEQILQMNIIYRGGVFHRLIREAYIRQLWEVIHLVFQKSIQRDNNSVLLFLNELYLYKDWKNLECLFKILDKTLKIDVTLAEALRENQHKEAQELLKGKTFDVETLSGTFLVACMGGVNEEVARLVMSRASDYSDEILNYGLLMSSIYSRMDILPLLIQMDKFSYHMISRAYNMALVYDCLDSVKLLKFSLANKACGIFPNISKSLQLEIMKSVVSGRKDDI